MTNNLSSSQQKLTIEPSNIKEQKKAEKEHDITPHPSGSSFYILFTQDLNFSKFYQIKGDQFIYNLDFLKKEKEFYKRSFINSLKKSLLNHKYEDWEEGEISEEEFQEACKNFRINLLDLKDPLEKEVLKKIIINIPKELAQNLDSSDVSDLLSLDSEEIKKFIE